jgi:hypothetical protein
VYLAARNETKALAAIGQMHIESPEIKKGNLIWLPLDLADLDSVVRAASIFMKQEDALDLLGMFIPVQHCGPRAYGCDSE